MMLNRNLSNLQNYTYDLVIIGVVIYGVCIAWDASLRGLSTALIEMEDFGHATSANSMKTIHGGLRYLQQFDVGRMRQSIQDRTVLMQIAPHLVHPLPILMPIYGHLMKGREMMTIALAVNDVISYDRNRSKDPQKHLPRGKIISSDECLQHLPGIEASGLSGGAIWYDGQVYNSERLTLSFALSAAQKGASIANYLKVTKLLRNNGRVIGVEAIDQLSGASILIQGKVVVNAAGPWVDQVLGTFKGSGPQLGVQLAKAVNIATRPLFKRYAVGLSGGHQGNGRKSVDRLFFITPWRNQALIGTTYKFFNAHPDALEINVSDVQELLDSFNNIYPPAKLSLEDVKFVYCGLVPISDVNIEKTEFKRARNYQIRDHEQDGFPGLITVLGVKYTTARNVAVKVIDQVQNKLELSLPPSTSENEALFGGDIEYFDSFLNTEIKKNLYGLELNQLRSIIYNYGTAYLEVLHYLEAPGKNGNPNTEQEALLKAQITYAVEYEMAHRLSDIIFRRTELGTGGHPSEDILDFCAAEMGKQMDWDAARTQEEIQTVKEAYSLKPELSRAS